MTRLHSINNLPDRQRGSVLIWFALLLPVLLGFLAFAIDLAYLYQTKVELQNAADAAALAGALGVSKKPSGAIDWTDVPSDALQLAKNNYVNKKKIKQVTTETGSCDLSSAHVAWHTPYVPGEAPAVKVTIEFSKTKNNGPLYFFFAPLLSLVNPSLGIVSSDVSATAVAAAKLPVASGKATNSILVQ